MRKNFCTCENFSFFQKSRKYAQNAMKTAIFSQFFINEKRVFSFNESHKNALRNAVFLMRGMLIFWMSFIWIFFSIADVVQQSIENDQKLNFKINIPRIKKPQFSNAFMSYSLNEKNTFFINKKLRRNARFLCVLRMFL